MEQKVFIDTSAWLAAYIPTEKEHQRVSQILKQEIASNSLLYTSNYIIDETITRLFYDTGWAVTRRFLQYLRKSIEGHILVELWVDEQCESEAFTIIEKYREHKLSFTDSTTVVLVQRYRIDKIVTLDSDFTKIGLRVVS